MSERMSTEELLQAHWLREQAQERIRTLQEVMDLTLALDSLEALKDYLWQGIEGERNIEVLLHERMLASLKACPALGEEKEKGE